MNQRMINQAFLGWWLRITTMNNHYTRAPLGNSRNSLPPLAAPTVHPGPRSLCSVFFTETVTESVGTEAAVRNSTDGASVHLGPAVLCECASVSPPESFLLVWLWTSPSDGVFHPQPPIWPLISCWLENGRQGGEDCIYSENKQC